jgi:hypothetical protein
MDAVIRTGPAHPGGGVRLFNVAVGEARIYGAGGPVDGFSDPAGLSKLSRPGGVFFQGQPFQLPELQQTAGVVGLPLNRTGLAVAVSTFGNQVYQESLLAFIVGHTISSRLSVGVTAVRYGLRIKHYGQARTIGFTVSWHYRIDSRWIWSTALRNVNAPRIGRTKEPLPQVVTTGFLVTPTDWLQVNLEWEHDLEYPGRLKFGVLSFPLRWFGLAGGYAAEPGRISAGVFFRTRFAEIHYATVLYQELGRLSRQVGVAVHLDRR